LVVTKIDERQTEPDQGSAARAVDILAERLPTVPRKVETAQKDGTAPPTAVTGAPKAGGPKSVVPKSIPQTPVPQMPGAPTSGTGTTAVSKPVAPKPVAPKNDNSVTDNPASTTSGGNLSPEPGAPAAPSAEPVTPKRAVTPPPQPDVQDGPH
jgi:hypothetical protein